MKRTPSSGKIPTPSRWQDFRKSQSSGFTLIEIIITIGITGILLALVVTRYQRGNEDSILNREVARITSTIHLAQQQTASGEVVSFCSGKVDQSCTNDTNCAGVGSCQVATPPEAGMSVLFSCASPALPSTQLYVSPIASSTFFMYGDRTFCASQPLGDCFPPSYIGPWTYAEGDGLITSYVSGGNLLGDPKVGEYALDSHIDIRNLRLTVASTGVTYQCSGGAPWANQHDPIHHALVPANYPLQGVIHFTPPSGTQLTLSDNVSVVDPVSSNVWEKLDVLVGVKGRTIACRNISVSREGAVTNTVSTNCDFNP